MNYLWNLRCLTKVPLVRRLVLWCLSRRYCPDRIYEIRNGPLLGYKWFFSAKSSYWIVLGCYERETSEWLRKTLKPGDTFFDVGANVGYFTLFARKLVGPNGRVFAFEPDTRNLQVLRRNLEINQTKAEVISMALSDRIGKVRFIVEENGPNSHLGTVVLEHAKSNLEEEIDVMTTTLEDFVERSGVSPSIIKMDVEGAELLVLKGGARIFSQRKPTCIISTHSGQLNRDCRAFLAACDYRVSSLPGFEHELVCEPKSRKNA